MAGPVPAVEAQRGFSIRIFLADGAPEGLWLVEKANWTGIALAWPRSIYARVRQRPEVMRTGVYVLIGPSEDALGRLRVYVGEAEVLKPRLDGHYADNDFWTRAVAFASKDESLNKAHARYLEARLVALAHGAQRSDVQNGTVPKLPNLSEADTADLETFLDEMLLIYPVLDVRAFEPLTSTSTPQDLLFAQGPEGAKAEGKETPDGFVVFSSSRARAGTVLSVAPHIAALREELVANGVLVKDGETLRFTQDYLFNSPSQAAGVVLGQSVNGRLAWKDAAGRTLKDIQAAVVDQT